MNIKQVAEELTKNGIRYKTCYEANSTHGNFIEINDLVDLLLMRNGFLKIIRYFDNGDIKTIDHLSLESAIEKLQWTKQY